MRLLAPRGQLDRARAGLAPALEGGEPVIGGPGAMLAVEEARAGDGGEQLGTLCRRHRLLEQVPRAVQPRQVLVIVGHQHHRGLERRRGVRHTAEGRKRHGEDQAQEHRRSLQRHREPAVSSPRC
jgi:hypothetical protein